MEPGNLFKVMKEVNGMRTIEYKGVVYTIIQTIPEADLLLVYKEEEGFSSGVNYPANCLVIPDEDHPEYQEKAYD